MRTIQKILDTISMLVDTITFTTAAIAVSIIGTLLGLFTAFAGLWYGWVCLSVCLIGAIAFSMNLDYMKKHVR